jgi:hypothetical protein
VIAGWALAPIAVDSTHVISPIVLAWVHPGLRKIALKRPVRSIVLPVFAIIAAVLAGALGPSVTFGRQNLPAVAAVYLVWNAYHFGMQNFGVARLLRAPGPRWLHYTIFCGGTVAIMALGFMGRMPPLAALFLGTILISWGHWLTEIVLTAHVIGWKWRFMLTIAAFGCVCMIPAHLGALFSIRIGLGFAHFLYDRWIWKMSDPAIRETIGPRLRLAA